MSLQTDKGILLSQKPGNGKMKGALCGKKSWL